MGSNRSLIVGEFIIDQREARAIIDTGATASFLPENGSILIDNPVTYFSANHKAKTADNVLLPIEREVHLYTSHVNSRCSYCKYLVLPNINQILGFDAIFGLDLIKKFEIQLKSIDNEMVATVNEHKIGREVELPAITALTIRSDEKLPESPVELSLKKLLFKYKEVFSEEATSVMDTEPKSIRLIGQHPVKAKLRRQSPEDIVEMHNQIQKLLKNKIIEPSQSSFSSNAHLVPKKNGQKRLVVNFIPLNAITVKDHFPMPQLSDLFTPLKDAEYFAARDCTEGFFQLPILREHREKTAFITPHGLYQFRRCPFGFTNSPAHFQRAMNDIFLEGLYKRCVVYIDDILVFGKTKEELISNLEWVLDRYRARNVQIKQSKCKILEEEVEFLGFLISKNKIGPVPGKYNDIGANVPQSKRDVRAILGKLNYYSRFIPNYSEETKMLRFLTKKDVIFEWTSKHSDSLKKLKMALDNALPNRIPATYTPKILEILVGTESVEAVCFDEDEQLVARAGLTLSCSEVNYTPVEKQLIGIVHAFEKFGTFLRGSVTVRTTCKELETALKTKEKTQRVNRMLLQLPPDADFTVKVIPKSEVVEVTVRSSNPPDEIFYTDGACTKNGTTQCKASWAVVATTNPTLTKSGMVTGTKPSNQIAELTAIIEACKIAKREEFNKIMIVTDSRYAANAVNKWIDSWATNGWKDHKNKPVTNEETFKELLEVMKGLDVSCVHVKGHSGDINNSKADQLARQQLEETLQACLITVTRPDFTQGSDDEIEFIRLNLAIDPRLAEKYTVINDKLYYIDPSRPVMNRNRLVVPKPSRNIILSVAHDDPIYGGHLGVKKTRDKLSNYYWPKMNDDIEHYIKTCELCQHFKTPKQPRFALLQPIAVSKVFERLHIDIIGPIKKSSSGNQYIVTAIDAFSRWGSAKAYADVKASDIVSFMEDEIICRHGIPNEVVSDNGSQFVSRQFEEYMIKLGVKHNKTSIYHPAANGMDERFNGSLVKVIRNYIESNQTDWDAHIKWALFVHNTTRNESTMISPYALLYGFNARTPLNCCLEEGISGDTNECASLEDIRKAALHNMKSAQSIQKRNHDSGRRQQDFQLFDLVMIRSFAPPRGDSSKLAHTWKGPAMVIRIVQHNDQPQALEVLELGKFKSRVVSFQDIKHFNQRLNSEEERKLDQTLPGEFIKRLRGAESGESAHNRDGNSTQRTCLGDLDGAPFLTDIVSSSRPTANAERTSCSAPDESHTSVSTINQNEVNSHSLYSDLDGDPFLTDVVQEEGQMAERRHVEPVASECLTSESSRMYDNNINTNYSSLDGDQFPTDVVQKKGQTAAEQHVESIVCERLTIELNTCDVNRESNQTDGHFVLQSTSYATTDMGQPVAHSSIMGETLTPVLENRNIADGHSVPQSINVARGDVNLFTDLTGTLGETLTLAPHNTLTADGHSVPQSTSHRMTGMEHLCNRLSHETGETSTPADFTLDNQEANMAETTGHLVEAEIRKELVAPQVTNTEPTADDNMRSESSHTLHQSIVPRLKSNSSNTNSIPKQRFTRSGRLIKPRDRYSPYSK